MFNTENEIQKENIENNYINFDHFKNNKKVTN